jgi:hypothetical protein
VAVAGGAVIIVVEAEEVLDVLLDDRLINAVILEMKNYLTRQYDVGDGPLFTRSPVEYAKHLKAQKVEQVITRNIMELEGLIPGSGPKFNQAVGEVTHERAALAKARLQALKDAKK